ncbi:STN and carboxypeptidase regulatory-like domain-containing protein [Runella slithyformis]|uniref:Secretin/TonB short domain protein n=1 Tax=Runella slithyformis (strain ATCC 29530 / DSM 19594 / LMG 11500 / NCIMB 11436 / LSU 4) TaxID=761193 RepID=A0A7U4E5S0_RUNSL|nr:STN and carboxypeptidase regulatory-like domain-containing protein [Runella slithyformis]AEI48493.1 Secretin/TonB short domain protein [Runella slithyformis DSM 19594]
MKHVLNLNIFRFSALRNRVTYVIFLLLFGLVSLLSFAQKSSILDRTITVRLTNERLEDVLRLIGERGHFSFSYNPNEFDLNRRITLNANGKAVRQVLDEVFKGSATYKERRGHIILQKLAEIPVEKPQDIIINGYVFDRATGERIAQASIFEKRTLASAVTNQAGYYRIKIPSTLANPRLEVRKERYFGTGIAVTERTLDISLVQMPLDEKLQVAAPQLKSISRAATDTFNVKVPAVQPVLVASNDTALAATKPRRINLENVEKTFVDAFASAKQAVHIQNVRDTFYRPFQVSLLPFVGTNHVMSGNVVNSLSFNIIAGYSLGVNALEFGGFANLVRWDVHGAQFAGFANLVGRNVYGLQASGFVNAVLKNVEGMQLSGFVNATGGNHSGVQVAGFANLTGQNFYNGFQTAGFASVTLGKMYGWQMSGFGNVTLGDMNGWQISGFGNVALQKLRGVQISPFINYATVHEKGLQLGVFNYADSSGAIPVGLFSFVRRNGYRRLEISTDELNYANVSFKTGVRRFYNIVTIGGSFGVADKPLYTFGYGVGTAVNLGRGWMTNLDLTANKIMEATNRFGSSNGNFYRASLGLEKKIARQLALFGAASFTILTAQPGYLKTDKSTLYQPFANTTLNNGLDLTNWLGFQAGIRILNR